MIEKSRDTFLRMCHDQFFDGVRFAGHDVGGYDDGRTLGVSLARFPRLSSPTHDSDIRQLLPLGEATALSAGRSWSSGSMSGGVGGADPVAAGPFGGGGAGARGGVECAGARL